MLFLLLPLLSACASFDAWQRQKVYRPVRIAPGPALAALQAQHPGVRVRQVALGSGGQLQLLEVPAASAAPQPAFEVKVLYLHGTGANAWQNLHKIEGITRNGLAVVAPDYRGWGASTPLLPSEESIYQDAWATWQALHAPAPSLAAVPVRWVIYGHSMGSAVAVQLAQRLANAPAGAGYCALVLESSFTSLPDVARSAGALLGPVLADLSTQQMASIERIGSVHGPLWMLHGSHDTTVPMALGQALFAAAPGPKTWLALPLAHSDLQTDTSGQYDKLWRDVKASCSR